VCLCGNGLVLGGQEMEIAISKQRMGAVFVTPCLLRRKEFANYFFSAVSTHGGFFLLL
jgi:hypothetical protein